MRPGRKAGQGPGGLLGRNGDRADAARSEVRQIKTVAAAPGAAVHTQLGTSR